MTLRQLRVIPSGRGISDALVKTDKIYLVGFMAAGKTTLAQALARRLGWRAEDVDALIEARERRTVAEIFAREGEPYFRSVERQVIWSLLPQRHAVIATGGGTFVDPENRAAINADGAVGLDRRAVRGAAWTESRPTAAGRSPTIASRWRCSTRAAASRISRRRCASTRRARARKSWSSSSSSSSNSDALSGPQRHSQQPRGARRGARPPLRRSTTPC